MTGLEIVNLIRTLDSYVDTYYAEMDVSTRERFAAVREHMEATMIREVGK